MSEIQQPFTVHQFHFSASAGDAITNQMLFLQASLKQAGIDGDIFAKERKQQCDPHIKPFSVGAVWNCDLLLLHHSHGNPILEDVLHVEIPKALVYHNITPAHFFRHDPKMSSLCEIGRNQMKQIKSQVIASFAVSAFNASELYDLGYEGTELLPLLDLGRKAFSPSHPSSPSEKEPLHLVFVGRIAPHKNQALLIELFSFLKHLAPKHSKLYIVGGGDPIYLEYLKLLAKNLGVSSSVVFTGKVTDKELEHYYEMADAFVCPSLHEGFCVPLVEAMTHKIPVFYLPNTGVVETMGNAGVALESTDPRVMAHAIFETLRHAKIRGAVLDGQYRRLLELQKFQSKETVQKVLLDLLMKIRHSPNPSKKLVEQTL